jgi:Transglutaminase-like superfamily
MLILIRAFRQVLRFEYHLICGHLASLQQTVRTSSCSARSSCGETVQRICRSIDLVCAFYFKPVLCLQRSAATTCLLRQYGVNAEMVIGVRQVPFKAHAWVEVSGHVVNDKSYVREMYSVLDRC